VGAFPQKNYKGETGLLTFQNFHRYALYTAIIFLFILYYDAAQAFFYKGGFGAGIGTLVLLINPTMLALYTLGCHSFRHLIGGQTDCFSCSKTKFGLWKKVTYLNERHQLFAWLSLFWVGFTDFYIRMVSMGIIKDYNTWGI
ncbi:MAG: succinate dehydrogenase, partial [Chlorobi bacterium]|nr:succinate dehydrogenase [Chlorobiota bacterium]